MKFWVRTSSLATLLTLTLFTQPQANAFEANALAGLNFASPFQTISGNNQDWIGNAAPAFGLLLASDILSSPFDFESGVVFLSEKYEHTVSGVTTSRNLGYTQIPFVIRLNFDQSVGIGVGGYLAYSRGNRDSALTAGDQGLIVNIRAKFHTFEFMNLILDARYQHGLANMSIHSSDTCNTRSVQILGGASVPF